MRTLMAILIAASFAGTANALKTNTCNTNIGGTFSGEFVLQPDPGAPGGRDFILFGQDEAGRELGLLFDLPVDKKGNGIEKTEPVIQALLETQAPLTITWQRFHNSTFNRETKKWERVLVNPQLRIPNDTGGYTCLNLELANEPKDVQYTFIDQ